MLGVGVLLLVDVALDVVVVLPVTMLVAVALVAVAVVGVMQVKAPRLILGGKC